MRFYIMGKIGIEHSDRVTYANATIDAANREAALEEYESRMPVNAYWIGDPVVATNEEFRQSIMQMYAPRHAQARGEL